MGTCMCLRKKMCVCESVDAWECKRVMCAHVCEYIFYLCLCVRDWMCVCICENIQISVGVGVKERQ